MVQPIILLYPLPLSMHSPGGIDCNTMGYKKAVKSIAKSVEYYYNLLDANLHLKIKVCGVGSDMHRV